MTVINPVTSKTELLRSLKPGERVTWIVPAQAECSTNRGHLMNTIFHNASGLTAYALACGYIQKVDAVKNHRSRIRLTLSRECGWYQVRAHDHTLGLRLEWLSEFGLSAARHHFDRLIRQYFSDEIELVRHDPRYTIRRELCADKEPRWVVVFDNGIIAEAETRLAAYVAAYSHRNPEVVPA